MFQRLSGPAALVALIGSLIAIPPSLAHAQGGNNPNTNRLDVPISGTVQNVGTIVGSFKISKFAIQDDRLVALGQLNGTVRRD